MKNWFKTWFNTEYYHILYKNRDYSEAEFFIKNLTTNLKISNSDKILDLACGKGRHSLFLNKLGFNVVGVDLSEASIKYANKDANERLEFFEHDMREPLPNYRFDYVFNLFTSIGYFDDENDNIKMLESVSSYLNDNGVLVIDFLNVNLAIKNMIPCEFKTIDGIKFKIEKSINNGVIEKNISFTDKGEHFEFVERVHALTIDHFKTYLNKANFDIIKYVGDYNLSNFDIENSNRLIIFAKKR